MAKILPPTLKQRVSPHWRFSLAFAKERQKRRMDSAFMERASPFATIGASHLLPGLAQRHTDVHLLLAAINGNSHGVTRSVIVHDLAEVLLIFDFLVVHGNNEVSSQYDGDVAHI